MKSIMILLISGLLMLTGGTQSHAAECSSDEPTLQRMALESDDVAISDEYLNCYNLSAGARLVRAHRSKLYFERDCEIAKSTSSKDVMIIFISKYSSSECALEVAKLLEEVIDQRQYTGYKNAILIGSKTDVVKSDSLNNCQAQCDQQREQCQGYSFDEVNNVCALFNTAKSYSFAQGIRSGSLRRLSTAKKFQYHNAELLGRTIDALSGQSFSGCRGQCIQNDRCIGFTHEQSTNRCYLKSNISGMKPSNNFKSGIPKQK